MNLTKLVRNLNEIVWQDSDSRSIIEKSGIKLSPCNYYSNIPSMEEIKNSFEYRKNENHPPYAELDIFHNQDNLKKLLNTLTTYSHEFHATTDGDEDHPKGFYWNNSQFSHADAMAYYSFIRHFKPERIIEIGSGFSTLVAKQATEKNNQSNIICVEPFPRPFLEKIDNVTVVKKKAQDFPPDWLNENLSDGDILFIDSTHTVKSGSDCLNIYLRMIPSIKHDIIVHIHDIFLPFGMPQHWLEQHIYWTEQYLLLAFLIDNPKVEFLFGSNYHEWKNLDALKNFVNGQCAPGGSSFWFRYRGNLS